MKAYVHSDVFLLAPKNSRNSQRNERNEEEKMTLKDEGTETAFNTKLGFKSGSGLWHYNPMCIRYLVKLNLICQFDSRLKSIVDIAPAASKI